MKRIQNKTPLMKQIETNTGEEIEEILRRLYVDKHQSQNEIMKTLSISYVTLLEWLKLAGIYSRRLHIGD
jgi:DNA invertase Pin-like site-specific DNA recombinase